MKCEHCGKQSRGEHTLEDFCFFFLTLMTAIAFFVPILIGLSFLSMPIYGGMLLGVPILAAIIACSMVRPAEGLSDDRPLRRQGPTKMK